MYITTHPPPSSHKDPQPQAALGSSDHAAAAGEQFADEAVANQMRLRAEEIRLDSKYLGLFDFLLFSAIHKRRVKFMFGVQELDVLDFLMCQHVLPHLAQLPNDPPGPIAVATWGERHEAHYNMEGDICMNHWMVGVPISSVVDPREIEGMRARPIKRSPDDVLDAAVACRICGYVLHPTVIDGNCAIHTMLMLLHGPNLKRNGLCQRLREMRHSLSNFLKGVSDDASWQQAWRLACEQEDPRRAPAAPIACPAEHPANSTDEHQAFDAAVIEGVMLNRPANDKADGELSGLLVSWHLDDFGAERVCQPRTEIAEDENRKAVDEAVSAFLPTLQSYPDTVANMPMEMRSRVLSNGKEDFASVVNKLPADIRQKVCSSSVAWEECFAHWKARERTPHLQAKQLMQSEKRRSQGRVKVEEGGVSEFRSRPTMHARTARVRRYLEWWSERQRREQYYDANSKALIKGTDEERYAKKRKKRGRSTGRQNKDRKKRDIPAFFKEQGIKFTLADQEALRRDIISFEKKQHCQATAVHSSKRNTTGAGAPIVGGLLGDELFQWFVDVRGSTKIRVPPKMVMRKAARIKKNKIQQ